MDIRSLFKVILEMTISVRKAVVPKLLLLGALQQKVFSGLCVTFVHELLAVLPKRRFPSHPLTWFHLNH